MKCISCEIDVPPQWVACIQANSCPSCAGPIMDDMSKELLQELKLAMEKMPKADAAGISGWILSNYKLTKIGLAEPIAFHQKKLEQRRPNITQTKKKLKVARNSVQEFLHRKDPGIAKSVEAQKDFANIVDELNNGVEDPYGNGVPLETEIDEESGELSGEVVSEEDYEAYEGDDEAYQEAISNRQNFHSKAQALARHSLVVPGGSKPLTSQETAQMMHAVAGKASGVDPGDDMPEVLQIARIERLKKQRAIAGGGTDDFGTGRGTFRRS